ncbi:BrnA antitoxin family protein [Methylobacterium sp. A54F]
MAQTRRPSDPRQAAEALFKSVTTKPVAPAPAPRAPAATPGVRESVTLRLDSAVLEHFQKDGPGWQDRINEALKRVAGL